MREVTPEFKRGVDAFINANQAYFDELTTAYQNTEKQLIPLFDKRLDELKVEDFAEIKDADIRDSIIELGDQILALKTSLKKKAVTEYILFIKAFNVQLCRLCEQAVHLFDIQDSIVKPNLLLQLIENYKAGILDEAGKRETYQRIQAYQEHFNMHHLKRFSNILFKMTYKELIHIKDRCYQETFANYSGLTIKKGEGLVYINKDGSKAE